MSDWQLAGPLLVAAAAFFPGPFVWAPLLIFCTNRMAAKPRVTPFTGDLDALPPAAAEYFASAATALEAIGFEKVGMYFLPNTAPRVEALVLLAKNPATDEVALATTVYATVNGVTQLKVTYVEFVSRYSNGRVLGTSNNFVLGCFAKIDGFETVQFPGLGYLDRLYGLHVERCRRAAPNVQRVNRVDREFDGDGSRYLSATMSEEFARQVGVGYLRLAGEHYRPTVKGACLMTWKLLFPVKQLRAVKRNRRAVLLLSEVAPAV